MKKIIALVITLSLVITMFASVTAFAATEIPWSGLIVSCTPGTTSKLNYSANNNKNLPSGTEYVVETAYFNFAADTKLTNVNIGGWYSMYPNQTLSEGNHTVDFVYSVDDDIFYMFVDKMFKGSVYGDEIMNFKRTTGFNHSFSLSVAPESMSVDKKAYGSDFNFKEMGFYGGTATYDKASGTYTLSRNIARMRTTQAGGEIGCYQYDDGWGQSNYKGMYIAGYDDNDKLLFVENTSYFVGTGNTQWGTAANITSAVTEEADSIKLFIYDAVHYNSANIVPAIEALEYKIQ